MDDEPAIPSPRLLDTAISAIQLARACDLTDVSARLTSPPDFPAIWPGEHYRLLSALVTHLQPSLVIEIGTYTGLSSLAMLTTLPTDSKLITFDIVPWQSIDHTHLHHSDFESGRLEQEIADLSDPDQFVRFQPLLEQADLVFVDGPKDIRFEEAFLKHLSSLHLPKQPLLVFDDIKLWNMLRIWRTIRKPKLDLTSFGHWSGTGLVDWVDGEAES
ncbi:MAG: hypothetical protein KDA52_04930 [Planctomycetaceae bacterium]|nr:hypothetical protein [Planctomycetaceae bacterium]